MIPVSQLLESNMPHAPESEISLLGAMIGWPVVIPDVLDVISGPEDFFKATHGIIFSVVTRLYDRDGAIDGTTLIQALDDHNDLKAIGGGAYIKTLCDGVPGPSNAKHYARDVRDKAIVRRLIDFAIHIIGDAHSSPSEPSELLDRAERGIYALAHQTEQYAAESIGEIVKGVVEAIQAGTRTGLNTGFPELDAMIGGMKPGELIILAARPSMGKTALAQNISHRIAASGTPVAFFSLEMSSEALASRMLSAESMIPGHQLTGQYESLDFERLHIAASALMDLPLFIDPTAGLTLPQFRAKARRIAARENIGLIVIDYLQLMSVGGKPESRQVEVAEISRGLKALARMLEVPILCLSQLNRQAETREGNRPRLSDLRESGAVEQDADIVMLLYREEYYKQSDPSWRLQNIGKLGTAEVIIAKHRNGATGVVGLDWDGVHMLFSPSTKGIPT